MVSSCYDKCIDKRYAPTPPRIRHLQHRLLEFKVLDTVASDIDFNLYPVTLCIRSRLWKTDVPRFAAALHAKYHLVGWLRAFTCYCFVCL